MNILVISNFYPPYHIGGYELGCRDVVEGLKTRGYKVNVLTSTYGINRTQCSDGVYRLLDSSITWRTRQHLSLHFALCRQAVKNRIRLTRTLKALKPDLIYIWNPTSLSLSTVLYAQQSYIRTAFFVSDHWLSNLESDPWYFSWLRRKTPCASSILKKHLFKLLKLAKVFPNLTYLDLKHVHFASCFLMERAFSQGKLHADGKVIHWGVDINKFPYRVTANSKRALLYVGQIAEHKGVHTAIEALQLITKDPRYEATQLNIVGAAFLAEYELSLRALVKSYHLERNVFFLGHIPRKDLPSVYQNHDILLFTSTWDEPFSITLLEALSSGLAVVATCTGGTPELLSNEVNALTFPTGDSETCAAQVLRLMDNPDFYERLRQMGRETVETRFDYQQMMEKIDFALQEALL